MRVIVVDDDKIVVKSLVTILGAMGIEVVGTASNGKEALEEFKRLHPDVVPVSYTHLTLPTICSV